MPSSGTKSDPHRRERQALRAVASFEFAKGVFVLLIGLSALLLIRQDVWVIAESLLALLHISTDRHSAQLFLDFADSITEARLWTAAWVAFTYSALRFTEAYGLWKERVWAEWVALTSGALLLPVEIHGLIRGITVVRSVIFAGNIAVVIFMVYLIRAGRRRRREEAAQPESHAWSGS
ncbi:MAG: DUF2127 domain-containing protein [Candidatus Sulfotelmatobacter sp.]